MPNDPQTAWPRIEAALDELLDLPTAARPSALMRLAGGDSTVLAELRVLLDQAARGETWLDRPAGVDTPPLGFSPAAALVPGQRIGAYEVVEMIGRGGMGNVYRARRVDGQYDHQVALKLIRPEAIDHVERFQAERQILARLDHPGITRILDGGLLDGQPYMVMELVEGASITTWCRDREAGLEERLTLFLAVCEAVAYAHRNLVVHRDLKPGNVLVTSDGQVKLLDFGIAKRLLTGVDGALADATRLTPLTPGYAAPEQLLGGSISTATDSYALGMLLFELLAGEPPWRLEALPLARALHTVLHETAPTLSHFAARLGATPPVTAKALAGDLDAIVAKALRKEPTHRYQTVEALMQDLIRMREGWPVSSRSGSRLYVMGRFVKRHRMPLAATAILALAILAGLGGISWQYWRAEREAARANTIKAFVLSLYGGRDPGFPADKPRRDVSAEKLLDLGVDRIEREFAQDPELEIELYAMTGSLYEALSDPDRAAELNERRVALARRIFGETHPLVIRALLTETANAFAAGQMEEANRSLARADVLIRQSGQDDSELRALWWLNKSDMLTGDMGAQAERQDAVEKAVTWYERHARASAGYPLALQTAAVVRLDQSDQEGAAALLQKALDKLYALPDGQRDDAVLLDILILRGGTFERLGRLDEARQDCEKAAALALEMQGMADRYWLCLSRVANMLHRQGKRDEALAKFDVLLKQLPPGPTASLIPDWIRLIYADDLTSEGRADQALPVLERYRPLFERDPDHQHDFWRVEFALGEAYAQLGRVADARASFTRAAEGYASMPNSLESLDLNGKFGWFLMTQQDDAAAAASFDKVLRDEKTMGAASVTPSLAWAGRARLALRRGDKDAAQAAIESGFAAYRRIRGLHDVRIHSTLLLTRSAVLLARGDRKAAADDAEAALADSLRTDAPQSPAIAQARQAVAAAGR
jgi:serine/threonine protein kinase/tetratricopeptide (TPR) repeat protein